MNRIFKICCALLITFVFYNAASAEQQISPGLSWQQAVPVRIQAKFKHSSLNCEYISYWNGIINMLARPGQDNTLRLEFRAGLGKTPCRLSSSWTPCAEGEQVGTAPVAICLVASGVDEEGLNRWIKAKNTQDPALVMTLSSIPNAPGSFTNEDIITGQVFVWDTSRKSPVFRRYADIIIPAHALELSLGGANIGALNIKAGTAMFSLRVNEAILDKVSAQAWEAVLKNGNTHLGLSGNALSAVSEGFSGSPEQKNAPDTASLIRELLNTLESCYIARIMPPETVQELINRVDDAFIHERTAELAYAIADIVRFEKKIKELGSNTGFKAADTGFILVQSNALLIRMITARKAVFAAIPFVPLISGGSKTWYVNQRLNCPAPDGSEEFPFPSIAAALEEARNQALRDVTLFVYGGVYREPLDITRDTAIIAIADELPVITESVTNTSGVSLSISGFYMVGASSPGAVWVRHSSARTVLNDVLIDDTDDFGIYQEGGEIELENVRVSRAHTRPGEAWLGSGIVLTGAAQALLNDVRSERNESHGILIDGAGTRASGNNLTIQRNHFNRNWEDEFVADTLVGGTGALEVRHNAAAEFSNIFLWENEIDGVLAYDNAVVTLSDANIERTLSFVPRGGWPDINLGGGIGVRARLGAHLYMNNFSVSRCDLVGVVVGRDGQIDLASGAVFSQPVGVYVMPDGYDLFRLMDGVSYYDNGRNLDTSSLPVPSGDTDIP